MILTRLSIVEISYVALAILCIMTNASDAGKINRNKTATSVSASTAASIATKSSKSAVENAPISSGETEAESTPDTAGATATTTSEKQTTVADVDDATSSLSIWGIVRSVWNWIRDDLSESLLGADDNDENDDASAASNGSTAAASTTTTTTSTATAAVGEGRTFGKIRRLQMALIPIIFKFGVLSAMVAFLVVLGMKTLFLLKLLVLMNAAVILGKFLTLKTNFGHIEHHPAPVSWGYSNWNPHTSSHGWSETAPAAQPAPSKEIHLHIHGAQTQPQVAAYSSYASGAQSHNGGWERRNDPYSGYEPAPVTDVEIENELNNQGPIAALPTKYPANHRY